MTEIRISTGRRPAGPTGEPLPVGPLIRASDIAQWVYCQRAWWLAMRGHENHNAAALKSGVAAHAHHGRQAANSHRARTIALVLLSLGVLALLLNVVLWMS